MCWTATGQTPAQWVWGPRCVLDLSYKVRGEWKCVSDCNVTYLYRTISSVTVTFPAVVSTWPSVRSNFGIILYGHWRCSALVIVTTCICKGRFTIWHNASSHIPASTLWQETRPLESYWEPTLTPFSHTELSHCMYIPLTCLLLLPTLYSLNYW